jgi:sulfate adenylyltransferase subunit 2
MAWPRRGCHLAPKLTIRGFARACENASLTRMTDAVPAAAIAAYAARLQSRAPALPPLAPALADLEAEALFVLRETAQAFAKPVLLYSIGKDSTVLAHLALKAFWPARPPFALLHIDSGWEFAAMAPFRDAFVAATGLELIVHRNEAGLREGINPFVHGSARFTDVMRTQALLEALHLGGYDAAIGGARRDEERSRAKERIFSLRGPGQTWEPRRQRPELWRCFNTRLAPGHTMRVFPLSNWTELDIWRYIDAQQIPLAPLYFAAPRPYVDRAGALIAVDDDRLQPGPSEIVRTGMIRFRTLGCYPLTGGALSQARTVGQVVAEIAATRQSERASRLIDFDAGASMEQKKREGYF